MMKWKLLTAFLFATAVIGLSIRPNDKPRPTRFVGLGDLPGGIALSVANAISADGKVVVGYSRSANGNEAFRWTEEGGIRQLGFPMAFATSAHGTAVVGHRLHEGRSQPVCWTARDGVVEPADSRDQRRGAAYGISADGSVIVGVVGTGLSESEGHDWAFRWRPAGEVEYLVSDRVKSCSTEARAVSADGNVVVGMRLGTAGHAEAFRWTAEEGFMGLGCLPGHATSCAYAVSSDGSVVVGHSSDFAATEAFRWTKESGMMRLRTCEGGSQHSRAYAVSADGTVVVGGLVSHRGQEAFIWDAERGMRLVQELLAGDRDPTWGKSLSGWRLRMATAVSADGSIVVGVGKNPAGGTEAWMANLSLLAVSGLGGNETTSASTSMRVHP